MASSNNSAKRFLVSGRVQGVGYRFFVEREAARLGISGYAQNLDDGRVEVYAIGSRDDLGALLVALRKGPTFASVSGVDENDEPVDPLYANDFRIKS